MVIKAYISSNSLIYKNNADYNRITNIIKISRISLLSIGLVCNLLTLIIFYRRKIAKNALTPYYRALAIFDLLIVVCLVGDISLIFFNTDLTLKSPLFCKLIFYIPFGPLSVPGWILVFASVEKMIRILNISSDLASILKRTSFKRRIIMIYSIFNCSLYLYIFIFINIKEVKLTKSSNQTTMPTCSFSNLPHSYLINVVHLVESTCVPFVCLMITTGVILVEMIRSRNRMKQIRSISLANMKKRKRVCLNYAISAIAFNVAFVVLEVPVSISQLVEFGSERTRVYSYNVGIFCFYLNFCIRFFLHVATNSLFRKEIQLILMKSKDQRPVVFLQSIFSR
jgi:hypothetical protein